MKILEYTLGLPPFRRGGLPRYSKELTETLAERHHDVTLSYPGHMQLLNNKPKFKFRKTRDDYKVYELVNPMPVSLGLGIDSPSAFYAPKDVKYIEDFLRKQQFDVIHIHTLMGLPLEFLQVAHKLGVRLIYTTHDFYGLCPKFLEKNAVKHLTTTKCSPDCMICPKGPSLAKMYVMQSRSYMKLKNTHFIKGIRKKQKNKLTINNNKISMLEAQKKYDLLNYYNKMFSLIDKFHFNSNIAKNIFEKYFSQINGTVLNITEKKLQCSSHNYNNLHKKIVFSYVGPYDYKKGFYLLEKVLVELRKKYKNFEVHVCGDNKSDLSFLKYKWVKNYGILTSEQMNSFYSSTDILIMPSLWHETFGFAVLEALCKGIICIASENVGSSDLLPSNLVFNDKTDLIQKIESFLSNPDLISDEADKVSNLNLPIDFDSHVEKVEQNFYY